MTFFITIAHCWLEAIFPVIKDIRACTQKTCGDRQKVVVAALRSANSSLLLSQHLHEEPGSELFLVPTAQQRYLA